jgi:hypothetical protein
VSAMRPDFVKIFEKVRISWYFKSPETDLHSRETLQYWLHLHLVAKSSSLTFKNPTSRLQYFWLWMWWHFGTQHWRCWSMATN